MSTITPVNIGATADDGTGDPIRTAFSKINTNTDNLNTDTLRERVVVKSASQLTGAIDSTKEYFLDGIIDLSGVGNIEVPAGGIFFKGYNFNLSKIICSDAAYTLFTSPVGGSGDILGADFAIEVTGAGSQVYDIVSATGFDATEFARINYNDCTSRGTITDYRQGLETGTGLFGGTPELTLAGTWVGGYFIETSIVRGLSAGSYSLFKAGAGFTMSSRFRSNQNIDLPTGVSFFDFSPSNFPNPSTIQMSGTILTRNGVTDATDPDITPNIDETAIACTWTNNLGMPNTFEGGRITVTGEAATVIAAGSTFYTLNSASHVASELQHFDNPSEMQLRHLGIQPRSYKVTTQFTIEGTAQHVLAVRVVKWDDSESSFVYFTPQLRQVNSLVGGRDVAFFAINENLDLDRDDYMFFEVANNNGNANVTLENDSYFIAEQR